MTSERAQNHHIVDAKQRVEANLPPNTGMLVIAMNASLIAADATQRATDHLSRLSGDYNVHVPGYSKAEARRNSEISGLVIPSEVYDRLRS